MGVAETTPTLWAELTAALEPHGGTYMADEVRSVVACMIRDAERRVLLEAAEEIERELVCCDVFERRDLKTRHHICYWGGAATKLVRDRAEGEVRDE